MPWWVLARRGENDLRRWAERPFHAADDAPLEEQFSAFVIALEVMGDLSPLHRGIDNLPALFPIGLCQTAHLVQQSLQRLILAVNKGVLPPLRIPLCV